MAILCGFAAFASVAFLSMRKVGTSHTENAKSELSPDSRVMAKPFRELRSELEQVVGANQENEAIKVIGAEALGEADRINEFVHSLLRKRDDLTLSLRSRSEVQVRKQRLEAGLSMTADKAALESAISAVSEELKTYEPIEADIQQIDELIREANQTLSAIKSRLVVASAQREGLADSEADMRQTLTDLRSLEVSFNDAEEFLRESNP